MNSTALQKGIGGHFYAVGIGPGSADLLTVRAHNILTTVDTIIAPRSCNSQESMALNAISSLLDRQNVEDCVYPMTRDDVTTRLFWQDTAQKITTWCAKGRAVAQITLGDPLIYSTSCYLLEALQTRMKNHLIHVIPGISAFQASSAIFGEPLTLQEDRMLLMPATDLSRVEAALNHCETLVLYKAGRHINALCQLLEKKGLANSARLVCYAEHGIRQYDTRTILDAMGLEPGYMATVIVHLNRCTWDQVSCSAKEVG